MAWFSLVGCTLVSSFPNLAWFNLKQNGPWRQFGLFLEMWLAWSIPYGLDPVVSYSPGLTWSSFAYWTLCLLVCFRKICMTWSILDPVVSCFQRLAWSSLTDWTLRQFGLFRNMAGLVHS